LTVLARRRGAEPVPAARTQLLDSFDLLLHRGGAATGIRLASLWNESHDLLRASAQREMELLGAGLGSGDPSTTVARYLASVVLPDRHGAGTPGSSGGIPTVLGLAHRGLPLDVSPEHSDLHEH